MYCYRFININISSFYDGTCYSDSKNIKYATTFFFNDVFTNSIYILNIIVLVEISDCFLFRYMETFQNITLFK